MLPRRHNPFLRHVLLAATSVRPAAVDQYGEADRRRPALIEHSSSRRATVRPYIAHRRPARMALVDFERYLRRFDLGCQAGLVENRSR